MSALLIFFDNPSCYVYHDDLNDVGGDDCGGDDDHGDDVFSV